MRPQFTMANLVSNSRAMTAAAAIAMAVTSSRWARAQTPPPSPREPTPESTSATERDGLQPFRGRVLSYVRGPIERVPSAGRDGELQQISASAWLEAHARHGVTYAHATLTV